MRYEAWVLTEAVTNSEIDRVGAQIDNRIAGLDGNLDCGVGARKIGQSLDQPARGERGRRRNDNAPARPATRGSCVADFQSAHRIADPLEKAVPRSCHLDTLG